MTKSRLAEKGRDWILTASLTKENGNFAFSSKNDCTEVNAVICRMLVEVGMGKGGRFGNKYLCMSTF